MNRTIAGSKPIAESVPLPKKPVKRFIWLALKHGARKWVGFRALEIFARAQDKIFLPLCSLKVAEASGL